MLITKNNSKHWKDFLNLVLLNAEPAEKNLMSLITEQNLFNTAAINASIYIYGSSTLHLRHPSLGDTGVNKASHLSHVTTDHGASFPGAERRFKCKSTSRAHAGPPDLKSNVQVSWQHLL